MRKVGDCLPKKQSIAAGTATPIAADKKDTSPILADTQNRNNHKHQHHKSQASMSLMSCASQLSAQSMFQGVQGQLKFERFKKKWAKGDSENNGN